MMRLVALGGCLLVGMTALADDPEPKAKKALPETSDVDVAKTAEKIAKDASEAGKRLGEKDAGEGTQNLQKEALKNIDALLGKAQEPPPPPKDGDSPTNLNMGGGMSKQKNMGGGMDPMPSPSLSRKERREKNKSQAGGGTQTPTPMQPALRPDPKTSLANGGGQPNKFEPKGMPPRIPDVYKDIWGHLPEKMRQEMDLYFREQFMPRYSDLLRQYYTSLAERGGKSP